MLLREWLAESIVGYARCNLPEEMILIHLIKGDFEDHPR